LAAIMSGRGMGFGLVGCALLGALMLGACGGQSLEGEDDESGGRQSGGSGGGLAWSGSAGRGGAQGTGGRAKSGFIEPECPTAPPPAGVRECDPFGDGSDCPLGDACYPYIEHPYGEGCDAQSFGSRCRLAGTGVQGAICGSGSDGCAAGYLCVIGLQSGRRCAKMCTFDGSAECEDGLICGETDVEGYGVCS
jgi:hypothetical protein